jgi:D-beta-D-heptose 7-phosphate kinase/D-beta-D-heptose 1-phosphate adenosyltransferase
VISSALQAINGFSGPRILVLGEAMLDSYLCGDSTRLCQEAPVPVVAVRERRDHPGGAANTAVNLAALGCKVELLSVIGDDSDGRRLCQLLAHHGVGTGMVAVQPGRQTLVKQRVMNGDRLLVRFDQGDTGPVGVDTELWLLDRLASSLPRVDALVISDYGYGVVTDPVVRRLEALQERHRRLIAVDARDLTRYRAAGVTVVKPNYQEAARLVGASARSRTRSRVDGAVAIGENVLQRTGAQIAAITLDTDGAVIVERGRPTYRTFAEPADQTRAAGAGDTYIGAFALALAVGVPTTVAADIASAAASVVVSREGTAACTADDVRGKLQGAGPSGPAHRDLPCPSDKGWRLGTERDEVQVSAEALALADDDGERRDRDDVGDRRAPALHQA